jgi:hypothetical protein
LTGRFDQQLAREAAVAAGWSGGYLAGGMPRSMEFPAMEFPAIELALKEFPPKAGR